MKKLILDTNIYGEMVIDKELNILKNACSINSNFLIYGFQVIRKELRDTSKNKSFAGRNLRVALLSLYDEFVGVHNLDVDLEYLKLLAKKYYETYKQFGGGYPENILMNDYLIVACASKKEMDIVVSDDDASMLSELSLKAYSIVNKNLQLKNPEFINYLSFKILLTR
jgi:hypothetical protein